MPITNKVSSPGLSTVCFHCGDNCNGHIVAHSKVFCCEGCKTVYEILDNNNLCDFYALNNNPGTSLKNAASSKRFSYLDDELVQAKLIKFKNVGNSKVTLYVPKVHCSSCIYLLENLHRINEGITASRVNFGKREVAITFNNQKISLRQVVEQLVAIGYEPIIQLDSLNTQLADNTLRRYYLKMGIAFFAFGNIMLLSFPEYLGLDVMSESVFRKFFGYINFALALPVMFYCASDFFTSAWHALRQRTLNMDVPIVLGIIAMFVRSSYEVFTHTGAGYFDTLASLILLMLIGRLFQNKTYEALSFERGYQSYFPVAVTVVNNGIEQQIPLVKLRVHDLILVRNMELIPADAILLKGNANIDYSFVTGEATPIPKKAGDMLYAGGKQVGGVIELEVVKEVSQSYLTQLWNDAAFDKSQQKNISSLATRVSRWFTPLIILVATTAMLFWWKTDSHRALNAFTSVLIIACPCALALSSPFTLGNVLRLLGRHKIYLKNALTIEKLAQLNTIVFDKTGTLTNTKQAKIDFVSPEGTPAVLSAEDLKLIKSLVYHSSHPLSKKINELLKDYPRFDTENFKEAEGRGIEGWINELHIKVGSKKYIYGENYPGINAESDFRHASKVYVQIDDTVKGSFLIKNEYRKGFGLLIKQLQHHYNVHILSGDNDAERNFLKQHVPESNLQFNRTPGGKLEFIKKQQQPGAQVMMVGDGLNDAGALQQANVGMVISDDINNFSPACDAIVNASQFQNINKLLQVARGSMTVIKLSFAISLLYNCVGIYYAAQGTMSPLVAAILMPLSSVTIITFTMLSSTYINSRIFSKAL
jgi:Cu+-exporting ATPase